MGRQGDSAGDEDDRSRNEVDAGDERQRSGDRGDHAGSVADLAEVVDDPVAHVGERVADGVPEARCDAGGVVELALDSPGVVFPPVLQVLGLAADVVDAGPSFFRVLAGLRGGVGVGFCLLVGRVRGGRIVGGVGDRGAGFRFGLLCGGIGFLGGGEGNRRVSQLRR
ncbi:hypothetical protein FHX42_002865 [Saccharopolyspora lacisalsi]|uniref:Uncharacterized protein n=1 Tax=Halosaccharopolyspora lacisalsi TaxID=1000566 RepID=A0A839DVJ1_9PSEU|nr:hypothetical protein [Halosaccharopolyspora lacisalsi]MBA8825514.1 hypothetical protein [Halosaccharopolyspora lacisalsi]